MQNIRLQKQLVAAIFAAVIAVFAQFTIPLPIVPLTLQTFIVGLTATILGRKVGSLAVIIYLVLGAIGLPVYAGGSAGVGGYPFMPVVRRVLVPYLVHLGAIYGDLYYVHSSSGPSSK